MTKSQPTKPLHAQRRGRTCLDEPIGGVAMRARRTHKIDLGRGHVSLADRHGLEDKPGDVGTDSVVTARY